MKGEKILTISIAAYNMEAYLEDALVSLANHEYLHLLDVIIVNDGSADRTPEIASKYVEKYPDSFTLINKRNGGYGSTINCSLKHARGKYIKLLDADDWFDDDNMIPYLEFLKSTEVDLILTPYRVFDCDINHPRKMSRLSYTSYEIDKIENITAITMYYLAVRTDLVRNRFVITENCYYTDVEWWLNVLICCESFVSLPFSIYCYRLGREGQSVSLEGMLKHIDEHEYISRYASAMYRKHSCLSGLEGQISSILGKTYRYRLRSRRTFQNIQDLFKFRRFIKHEAEYSVKYMDTIIKVIYKYPILTLMPYSMIMFCYRIYHKCKCILRK